MLYQRASQGGGSTPTVTTYPCQGGNVTNTITIQMRNGMVMGKRADVTYQYQSFVSGYVINGVFTEIAHATNCSITYDPSTSTITAVVKATAASTLIAYVVD